MEAPNLRVKATVHWIGVVRPLTYIPVGLVGFGLALLNPISDPMLDGLVIRSMMFLASAAAVAVGVGGAYRHMYYARTQALGLSNAGEVVRLDHNRVASLVPLDHYDAIQWRRPIPMRVLAMLFGIGFEERARMGVLTLTRRGQGYRHSFTSPILLDGMKIEQAFLRKRADDEGAADGSATRKSQARARSAG